METLPRITWSRIQQNWDFRQDLRYGPRPIAPEMASTFYFGTVGSETRVACLD